MRKIGININACTGIDDCEYIKKIAELGFSAIHSCVFDKERLARIADYCVSNGVEYENLHAPFGHINDIWFDGDAGEAMLKELIKCVDMCVLVGAKISVVHMSSGENAPPVTDIGRRRFTKLIDYAKQKDIRLAFENQRKISNLAWVFENFTSDDNVGFCWDCGHEKCFTPGKEFMNLFGERLICTHIHDNFGIYNQDSHLLPFDGSIDFGKVLKNLERVNFKGNLMLEVLAQNSNMYDSVSVFEYLSKAEESAKKLLTLERVSR